MKRILILMASVLLLASCSPSATPVIKACRLQQVGGLSFGAEGVTAELTLDADIDNPSGSRYTLESLDATLYQGIEVSPFAYLTMRKSVSVEPRTEATVSLPLDARFTRPLALLSGGFSTDLSAYTADIDLTIRKGSLKKRITQERVPLDELGNLLGQNEKNGEE